MNERWGDSVQDRHALDRWIEREQFEMLDYDERDFDGEEVPYDGADDPGYDHLEAEYDDYRESQAERHEREATWGADR